MIRTLVVNCAPILDYCQDAGKTAAETASDEMAMGAVQALCEFSLLLSKQSDSNLSLAALDNAQERFYRKKDAFRHQKMSKSAKPKVDELFARDSHYSGEQKIHKICAAMEVLLGGAEKVTTSEERQFQMHQNRFRQVATIWSDANRK
jgi:hypothetical protein